MSIQLDPPELGFRRPFTQEVTETLRLRNPNTDPVAFKVKTTAPKQYCVRPNSGRIEAGQQVEVSVLLQAMKEDPPLEAKCRDKFLVQSVAVPANEDFTNVATLWSSVEQTAKSSIQEKKIRVLFLPATGTAAAAAPMASGVDSTPSRRTTMGPDDEYGSPASYANTPATQKSVPPVGPVSRPESKPDESNRVLEETKSSTIAAGSAAAGAATGAAAAISNSVPKDQEDLRRQLASAQAQVAQLKDQAASGLRQRKAEVTSGEKTVGQATAQAVRDAPTGVPVALVAILCLLSFLVAYFLF